jgi:hypothetical protein
VSRCNRRRSWRAYVTGTKRSGKAFRWTDVTIVKVILRLFKYYLATFWARWLVTTQGTFGIILRQSNIAERIGEAPDGPGSARTGRNRAEKGQPSAIPGRRQRCKMK